MKVILLAGGKGKRLRPLTNTLPKPMVPLLGKPLIEYSVDLFKHYGYVDFIFTLGYFPLKIKNYFRDGKKFGIKTSYIIERGGQPLGTAGALSQLKGGLKETFIVCSGDILRNCDINRLIDFHKKKGGVATIGVYLNEKTDPKSIVEFEKTGQIRNFAERPKSLPEGMIYSNASIYIFEPKIFEYIPENETVDFGKDIFPRLLTAGERMYAYRQDGYFLDVGTPEKMEKAIADVKKGRLHYEK